MSPSRARAYTGLLLTVVATAILAVALVLSGRVPGPERVAFGPVDCPTTPADLSGQTVTVGSALPDNLTCAHLRGTVFDGIDLTQADLSGADAAGASFRHADLTQADLSQANLTGAHFDDATLVQATLTGADADGASFAGADLSQAEAAGVRMRDADLSSTDLTQAMLTGADLRGADLTFASLIQTELARADVHGAKLWLANSIQTQTGSLRIAGVEDGVVQLPYLVSLVFLLVMAVRVVRLFRMPPEVVVPLGSFRQVAERLMWAAAGFALGALVFYLALGQLAELFLVDALVAPVVAGLVFLLGRSVRSMLPRPTRVVPAQRLRIIAGSRVSG